MTTTTRRTYPREFKQEAVRLLVYPLGSDRGLHPLEVKARGKNFIIADFLDNSANAYMIAAIPVC